MPISLFFRRFACTFGRFARIGGLCAALSAAAAGAALADSADGTIAGIDENNNTLTLTNGKTYKLPGEFDYSGFHAGQKVTVFYDTDPGGAYISDIEVQGAKAADTETPGDEDKDGMEENEGEDGAPAGQDSGQGQNGAE